MFAERERVIQPVATIKKDELAKEVDEYKKCIMSGTKYEGTIKESDYELGTETLMAMLRILNKSNTKVNKEIIKKLFITPVFFELKKYSDISKAYYDKTKPVYKEELKSVNRLMNLIYDLFYTKVFSIKPILEIVNPKYLKEYLKKDIKSRCEEMEVSKPTEKQLEKLCERIEKTLSNNDSYWESYWLSVEYNIKEVLGE